MNRKVSIKRTRDDESSAERCVKRSSPQSQYYSDDENDYEGRTSAPSTPKRLLSSFRNVFKTPSPKKSSTPISISTGSISKNTLFSDVDSPTSSIEEFSPIVLPKKRSNYTELSNELSHLSITRAGDQSKQGEEQRCHKIFQIPEILIKILSFLDENTSLPQELLTTRRQPLSYKHALLIYKDEEVAKQVWDNAIESNFKNKGNPKSLLNFQSNNLYNCLFVNKFWCEITMEIITNKLFFTNEAKFHNYLNKISSSSLSSSSSPHGSMKRSVSNTSIFIMHKLSNVKQHDVDYLSSHINGKLEWIEMYICPKIVPNPILFNGLKLKKLILPGAKLINNKFLSVISEKCPLLQIIDLRACELVSDSGIESLAKNCIYLNSINLGRHDNGNLITDLSLFALCKNQSIKTIGLAGCEITDRGMWELAINCNDTLERLSLNNCSLLTDNSLPKIFENGFLKKLSVLEIRKVHQLNNLKPLIEFKRKNELFGRYVLIEGCEVIESRMRQQEQQLELMKSFNILKELKTWVNDANDGDVPVERYLCR